MKLRVKYCGGCNVIIDRSKTLKAAIEILNKA
jgi:Fe-S oxidoreductase